ALPDPLTGPRARVIGRPARTWPAAGRRIALVAALGAALAAVAVALLLVGLAHRDPGRSGLTATDPARGGAVDSPRPSATAAPPRPAAPSPPARARPRPRPPGP
ncbi:hypothetical protein MXD60_26425, partial [Frankia sp. AgB32]|nr:hypothetical protein [Frankia sp. AgB32]